MKKLVENFKKHIRAYIITFVVALVIGVAIFLTYYYVQSQSIIASINGTGIAFAVLAGFGGLSWVSRSGGFDTFSYGFNQMFSSMFAKSANKYHDLVAYKEEKNVKRSSSGMTFISFFLASLLFLIAFIVLEIYRHNIY